MSFNKFNPVDKRFPKKANFFQKAFLTKYVIATNQEKYLNLLFSKCIKYIINFFYNSIIIYLIDISLSLIFIIKQFSL